jgi:hypothetical protein
METDKILKLTDSKIKSVTEQVAFLIDAEKAELDIVHPYDMINNKKLKVAACKIIRKRLTEIYALTEKIEEQEKIDIVNLEVLIDESML